MIRKTSKLILTACILLLFSNPSLIAQVRVTPLTLSADEAAWLADHPEITFTGDPNWLPFEAFDTNGTYIGLVANYLATIEKQLGIHFVIKQNTSWQQAIEMAEQGQVDVISDVLANETVSRTHSFTAPYITSPLVVLSREVGTPIRDLNELGDAPIGIVKEYGYVWDLWEAYPQANMIDVDTIQDGLEKLNNRQIDYLVITQTVGQFHIAKANNSAHLHLRGQLPINIELGLAVRKDWPELVSILNKAIASLSPEQRYQIAESWYLQNSDYFQDNRDLWRLIGLSVSVVVVLFIWIIMARRQQKRLERREQRYAQALAAINAGEWELNKHTLKLYVSPAFLENVGITEQSATHHLNDLYNWIEPEDQPHVIAAFTSLLEAPDFGPIEAFSDALPADINLLDIQCRLKNPLSDTAPIWVSIKGRGIHKGSITSQHKLAGTIEDITELRRSSTELKQKDQLLASLLDTMPDLVSLKGLDRKYVFTNNAFQNFFCPSESLIGYNDQGLLNPELSEAIAGIEQQVIATSEKKAYSTWATDSYGNPSYFEIIKTPVFDENGDVSGILSVSRNSTERYQLTQELEQFKLFAEYSEQGMGMAHFDTAMCYLNPTLCRWLLGNDEAEYLNRSFYDFYPVEYHTQIAEEILPAVLNHGLWRGELELLTPDGKTIPTLETFFLVLGPDNEPLYIGDVIIDISAEKETQLALEHAKQEADRANASKSTFLTNMSHEIRTPLNAVLGYSQLLMKEPDLNSECKEQVRRINNAGQRLLSLINDVLDLSKIEAGKFTLNQDSINLTDELTELITLHKEKADAKHLSLIADINIDKNDWVTTDKTKFGQVIINLINNAIKFTQQGEVRVEAHRTKHEVSICISDTGAGISSQELNQLFQPFVQGRSGNQNGGTGLGLVLSRHIVEALGGTLTMESVLHQGTQVHINLPLPQQSLTPVDKSLVSFEQGLVLPPDQQFTALIVEDDAMSRDILKQFLLDTGFNIILAEDGLEGLSKACELKPDIVFTDIRMPAMDGVSLLNKLKQYYSLARIPIVAVTASSLEHERRYYLQQGFSDFVGKPIDFNWLITVIEEQLSTSLVSPQASQEMSVEHEVKPVAASSSTSSIRQPLSPTLISRIKVSAQEGDFDTVAQLCQASFDEHDPLYQNIQHALKQYDLEQVVAVLESATESPA
ncbi:transporter substrate-binding domain-containing protein [Neptunomonas phycophila]|uniref:ATP-binding protein n=1 Tax=Neptunomonas phycophila TaxID=1572645 RepID=UPI0026E1DC12|nr:transporter substrate-binding domain-containing protein [Neptunomonas phycophila]MDO6783764.1 transporter substrate-binding domain-containing protein [Neptunomonas phycophila]